MAEQSERDRLIGTYLNDHLTASYAGIDLFARAARSADPADTDELTALTREVSEDKDGLLEVMRAMGVRRRPGASLLGRLAERAGRLKPNGSLLHRTPLTTLVETEALRIAVAGKQAGWEALLALSEDEQRLPTALLERLHQRATDQSTRLAELHSRTARRQLGPSSGG